ncbi:maltose ABC transporter permease protein [Spiroplasma clarkii]|nr:hypothetical protein [Spiroplasma clarkii]ARU90941.1 maltose ABC transporter permease protein [Spiroplasma clarkii]
MEQAKLNTKQNIVELSFSDLLKPNKKYDLKNFKANGSWATVHQYFVNDETIVATSKQKIYKKFLENNHDFGAVLDIFAMYSSDQNLSKEFCLNLIANAFSKFDDKLKLDISITNELLYNIAAKNSSPENLTKITEYQKSKSEFDLKYFEFKNLANYEFIYQWNRINAVINVYFDLIGQKKLGSAIAKLFLIAYESKKELHDFISSSLIASENLSEDFTFNQANELLKNIYQELEFQNCEETKVKDIFKNLLSIIPNYQIEVKKTNFFKNILSSKKSGEKFKLYASDEILSEIGKDLK